MFKPSGCNLLRILPVIVVFLWGYSRFRKIQKISSTYVPQVSTQFSFECGLILILVNFLLIFFYFHCTFLYFDSIFLFFTFFASIIRNLISAYIYIFPDGFALLLLLSWLVHQFIIIIWLVYKWLIHSGWVNIDY